MERDNFLYDASGPYPRQPHNPQYAPHPQYPRRGIPRPPQFAPPAQFRPPRPPAQQPPRRMFHRRDDRDAYDDDDEGNKDDVPIDDYSSMISADLGAYDSRFPRGGGGGLAQLQAQNAHQRPRMRPARPPYRADLEYVDASMRRLDVAPRPRYYDDDYAAPVPPPHRRGMPRSASGPVAVSREYQQRPHYADLPNQDVMDSQFRQAKPVRQVRQYSLDVGQTGSHYNEDSIQRDVNVNQFTGDNPEIKSSPEVRKGSPVDQDIKQDIQVPQDTDNRPVAESSSKEDSLDDVLDMYMDETPPEDSQEKRDADVYSEAQPNTFAQEPRKEDIRADIQVPDTQAETQADQGNQVSVNSSDSSTESSEPRTASPYPPQPRPDNYDEFYSEYIPKDTPLPRQYDVPRDPRELSRLKTGPLPNVPPPAVHSPNGYPSPTVNSPTGYPPPGMGQGLGSGPGPGPGAGMGPVPAPGMRLMRPASPYRQAPPPPHQQYPHQQGVPTPGRRAPQYPPYYGPAYRGLQQPPRQVRPPRLAPDDRQLPLDRQGPPIRQPPTGPDRRIDPAQEERRLNTNPNANPSNTKVNTNVNPRANTMEPNQGRSAEDRRPPVVAKTPPPVSKSATMASTAAAPTKHPAPVRQYTPASAMAAALASLPPDPTTVTEVVTQASLDSAKQKAKAAKNDHAAQLAYAITLVEAANSATVPSQSGKLDQKATRKNIEKYASEAHKILKKLSSNGFAPAVYYFGTCFGASGKLGLEPSREKEFELYKKASKLGHAKASYRAAVCCELGSGVKKDDAKAWTYYKLAAQQGDTASMYKIGMVLLRGGLGQQQSTSEALIWLKRAADQADHENPHALYELARLYETADGSNGFLPHDEKLALELYGKAAALGYLPAQYKMGAAHEYGHLGCEIDPKRSIAWYARAAQKGDPDSELGLSGWYLTGADNVLPKSETESYLWARRASEKGIAKAEYAVGYFMENGIGTTTNMHEAIRWYKKAAGTGLRFDWS